MKSALLQGWEPRCDPLCAMGLRCPSPNTVRGPPAAGPAPGLCGAGPRRPEPAGAAGHLLCAPAQGPAAPEGTRGPLGILGCCPVAGTGRGQGPDRQDLRARPDIFMLKPSSALRPPGRRRTPVVVRGPRLWAGQVGGRRDPHDPDNARARTRARMQGRGHGHAREDTEVRTEVTSGQVLTGRNTRVLPGGLEMGCILSWAVGMHV